MRLGYTRLGANVFPPNFGSPSSTDLLGIPNLPQGPTINAGWPKFNISGLSAFGSTTSQPQYQIPNTYLASGVISLQRGAHNIRLGSDATYIQTAILDVSALRGTFNFSNTWTGNPFGDFLLGLPASYTQTSPTVAYNRNWIYNFFIQDDYRISAEPDSESGAALRVRDARSTRNTITSATTTSRPARWFWRPAATGPW